MTQYRLKLPAYFIITLITVVAAYVFLEQTSNYWTAYYYTKLGSAFMMGHTHLNEVPPNDLLALANPYDPTTRGTISFIWDSALYNGKYYLYFGAVPALMPWLPVKWLTGVSLTDQTITLLYATIGTISLLLLFSSIGKKIYPNAVSSSKFILIWLIAALPLCFGTAIPLLLKRPIVYEAAIAGAYAYTAIGITLLWYVYMGEPQKPLLWKLLASLCFGLAVGCRVFCGTNILILFAVWLHLFQHKSVGGLLKEGIALFTPWLLVIISIATYNHLRFGSIFETGASYQLGLDNYTLLGSLFGGGKERFYLNLQAYLFTPIPADNLIPWKSTFGRTNTEHSFGVITHHIFIIWCLYAIPFMRAQLIKNSFFFSLMLGIVAYGALCFILLMFYNINTGRYIVDFSPWLMLCASLSFMHLAQTQKTLGRQRTIIALGALMSAWTVYSGFFAFSCIKCSYSYS